MGPKIATRIGDRALAAAARVIVREAKRRVPVRTGQLKKSIAAIKGRGRASERLVQIGFRPPASRRAHFTEFGTSRSAAKPFMRPALDAKAEEALRVMTETLAVGIARAEWRKAIGLIAEGVEIDFGD
jgi:HK97 gp10 family phage protein